MGLRMASAWKHPKTGKWWFRRLTPSDLLAKRDELAALGIKITLEVKHTLSARDDADAEIKWCKANEVCMRRFEAMRNALVNGPSSLTQKQTAALAGDIARQLLASDAVVADGAIETKALGKLRVSWEQTIELFKLIEVHGLARYPSVEAGVAKLMQVELLKQGIIAISHQSSEQLKARIVRDLPNVAKMLAAIQDDGDYREPEWVKGRPKLQEAFSKSSGKVTFKQLLAGWQRDRAPKPASVKAYGHWCAAFVRWREGNDDAATITRKDMIAWKEALQSDPKLNGKGIKLKLEGVRSILEWGIANEKLPYEHNPARGVTVAASKSKKKGWPDEQAALILARARDQSGYLRWAPLLMAVTGARAGEIAQLRLSDLKEDAQGRWSVTILPEAGTVKTEAGERTIPLHSAVVKEGFPRYVRALDKATDLLFPKLFSTAKRKKPVVSEADATRVSRLSGDQMGRWLYGPQVGLKPDTRYSPRHAWRHRISSLMREHCPSDAEARLAALLGHANESITARYGNAPPLRWIREGIESIPRDALFGIVKVVSRRTTVKGQARKSGPKAYITPESPSRLKSESVALRIPDICPHKRDKDVPRF